MPLPISSSTRSRAPLGKKNHVPHALSALSIVCGALAVACVMMSVTFQSHAFTAPTLQIAQNAGNVAWGPGAQTDIGLIVGNIIQVFLGILGVIFVVLLMYGGFLWLTARGEEDKVHDAQSLIFNALIGIIIIVAAYTITYFVLQKLVQSF